MKNLFLILFLSLITQAAFGQWFWGSVDSKDTAVNLTLRVGNNADPKTIEFGTANPTAVATDASQGSVYISTTAIYQKQDNGSSTNWQPLLIGPSGSGTDECVARWNGTGVSSLQDSVFCITDLGVGTGLTQFNVDNLRLDGNTISSTAGNIIISPTTVLNIPGLAASLPVKTDASSNLVAAGIDLSSATEVLNTLPINRGGTNSNSALNNNRVMISSGGAIVENAALAVSSPLRSDGSGLPTTGNLNAATELTGLVPLANGGTNKNATASNGAFVYSDADSFELSIIGTAGQPVLSGGAGAPTYFGATGVVKATAGVLSTSAVDLTTEVTGILPLANGGTNKNMTAVNGGFVWTDADSQEVTAAGTAGQPVLSGGAGTPTYFGSTGVVKANAGVLSTSNVSLTTEVTGVLPEANGGTNQSTYATGDILYASAPNVLSKLPAGANGDYLQLTAGVPDWVTVAASGVQTIGTIDSVAKSANGGVISGTALIFQNADGTFPGLVSVAAQSFAGLKTFINGIIDSTLTTGRVVFTSTAGRLVDSATFLFNSATGLLTVPNIEITSTTEATRNMGNIPNASQPSAAANTDKCYMDTTLHTMLCSDGVNWNVQGIQPENILFAETSFAGTVNCRWNSTGSFTDFAADADCASPVNRGMATTTDKQPEILIPAVPLGDYVAYVVMQSNFTTAATECYYILTDGTTQWPISSAGSSGANWTGSGGAIPIQLSSAQTNYNLRVQSRKIGGGGECAIYADTSLYTTPFKISLYRQASFKTYSVPSNGTVFSAKISSTGVVSGENVDFISGNCGVATSTFTCTFVTSFFSVTPNCTTTGNASADGFPPITSQSATGLTIITSTASSGAGVTYGFNITCQKTGADFDAAKLATLNSRDAVTAPNSTDGLPKDYIATVDCDGASTITNETYTGTPTIGNIAAGSCVITIPGGNFTNASYIGCEMSNTDIATNQNYQYVFTSTTSLTVHCADLLGNCASYDGVLHCHQR